MNFLSIIYEITTIACFRLTLQWKYALFYQFFSSFSRRLGLKSKSHGKGTERFITISRKFDGEQIIEELLSKGGFNEKYIVIPPNNKNE